LGQCRVLLELEFSGKRQRVSYEVTLSHDPPPESLALPGDLPKEARPSTVWVGPRRIEVFTEDRGAPTGLSSVVFLRATSDDFAPSPGELLGRFSEEGEWNELRPDALGLVALPLRPFDMSARLTVRGSRRAHQGPPAEPSAAGTKGDAASSEPVSDARLEPLVVYSGISLAVHNPLLQDQEPLRLTARQLSSHGPLLVDAFQNGRYVAGFNGRFQGGVADVRLRLPGPGLYRLQLASSPFSTDKALAVRHVYALSASESPNDALRLLLDRLSDSEADRRWAQQAAKTPLEQGVGFDRQTLAAFALARLYGGARPLERLLSSRQEDDAELARFKNLFQRGVMFSILLLGMGVAALFCLLAISASRRQGRITAMILSEPIPDHDQQADPWHTDHGRAEDRWRTPLSAAVLFVVVLGAFAALAVLVFVLRWFG
jgi:hypothetical protein